MLAVLELLCSWCSAAAADDDDDGRSPLALLIAL